MKKMKQIEYFYNVIYYFFYRASIKIIKVIDFFFIPIIKIFYFFINRIPSINKYYISKENDNSYELAIKRLEEMTLFYARTYAFGFSISIILFIYMGIYHIILYLFFPTFQDNFGYVVTIIAILAFLTDVILSQVNDKGEKYIKEFNKRKGWWRTKWKIISILSLFLSLWFSLTTSSGGNVGQFLISLHSNI